MKTFNYDLLYFPTATNEIDSPAIPPTEPAPVPEQEPPGTTPPPREDPPETMPPVIVSP
ncbi:hypothetical protein ACYZTL_01930 [Pseudomonas sp. LB3P81]